MTTRRPDYDPVSDLYRSITDAYQRANSAAELQRRLATVRGTGYDADRLVCAVVSGAGELVDLKLHPAAIGLGPARLGAAIVAASRQAQHDTRQRGYNLMALALGDRATSAVEAADSPAPARDLGWDTVTAGRQCRAAESAAGQPAAGTGDADHADDDDVFSFDASIFRSDR